MESTASSVTVTITGSNFGGATGVQFGTVDADFVVVDDSTIQAWAPPQAAGTNPPAGVVVNYWLRDKPKEGEKVTLEFLDGETVIRTFSNEKPSKAEEL